METSFEKRVYFSQQRFLYDANHNRIDSIVQTIAQNELRAFMAHGAPLFFHMPPTDLVEKKVSRFWPSAEEDAQMQKHPLREEGEKRRRRESRKDWCSE